MRVRDGEVLLTDGPFAETKDLVAGFDMIECADLDEAIDGRVEAPDVPRRGDRAEAVLDRLSAADAVAAAYADEWGRVVATLIRLTGDWDLAEECAQDAFAEALAAMAARRRTGPTRRLADHDRAQPRARPDAPVRRRGDEAAGGAARMGDAAVRRRVTSRTSGSS